MTSWITSSLANSPWISNINGDDCCEYVIILTCSRKSWTREHSRYTCLCIRLLNGGHKAHNNVILYGIIRTRKEVFVQYSLFICLTTDYRALRFLLSEKTVRCSFVSIYPPSWNSRIWVSIAAKKHANVWVSQHKGTIGLCYFNRFPPKIS